MRDNVRAAVVIGLVDELAVSEGHAYRARVRLASLFPPTGPGPTDDDVRAAVTATAPAPPEELA